MNTAGIKFLLRDRGGQFTDAFNAVFADVELRVLENPPQAPKANAHCKRFIGTLRPRAPRPDTHPQRTAPAPNSHSTWSTTTGIGLTKH
ncbi:hypothetical protein ACWFRJ_30510 [Streptomyces sp. NPDC055239]